MQTMEIAPKAWVQRLNEFTRVHDGQVVSIDVLGPEIGAQPQIANLPLIGISADRVNHDGTIVVSVARPDGGHFTHIIERVTRVYIERTDDGVDAALQIESAGGTRTLLRLRATADRPDAVDEVVAPG